VKKGIVMSIDEDFLTVLTPNGEFLRARKQEEIEIGEEISFFPVSLPDTTRSTVWRNVKTKRNALSIISTLAAIILIITFIPMFATTKQVYAYVSIDINPSLELGVDNELEVLSIIALNEDGEKLLSQLPKWRNKHIDTVTKLIIDGSVDNGYLEQGQEVVLTTVVNDSESKDNELLLQSDLEELGETYEKENNFVITTIESNIETREKAKQQGLSTGKLVQKERQEAVKQEEKITDEIEKTNENVEENQQINPPTENNGVDNKNKENGKGNSEEKKNEKNNVGKNQQENKKMIKQNVNDQVKQQKEEMKQSSNKENRKIPNHVRQRLEDKFKEVPKGWNREEKGK
jgi:hypothetical protein